MLGGEAGQVVATQAKSQHWPLPRHPPRSYSSAPVGRRPRQGSGGPPCRGAAPLARLSAMDWQPASRLTRGRVTTRPTS
eukprot:15473567-Alexandrium_andersonii.AAC.1